MLLGESAIDSRESIPVEVKNDALDGVFVTLASVSPCRENKANERRCDAMRCERMTKSVEHDVPVYIRRIYFMFSERMISLLMPAVLRKIKIAHLSILHETTFPRQKLQTHLQRRPLVALSR